MTIEPVASMQRIFSRQFQTQITPILRLDRNQSQLNHDDLLKWAETNSIRVFLTPILGTATDPAMLTARTDTEFFLIERQFMPLILPTLRNHPLQQLIVPCDHFAIAEMYSKELNQAQPPVPHPHLQRIGLNVLLNTGGIHRGVRPGRDAADLSSGIARFSNLAYRGYQLNLLDDEHDPLSQILTVTKHSLTCLKRWSLTGSTTLWTTSHKLNELIATGFIEQLAQYAPLTIITTPHQMIPNQVILPAHASPAEPALQQVTGYKPDLQLLAKVLSRPSIEEAIIDAGSANAGIMHHPTDPPVLLGWPDAVLTHVMPWNSVWTLGEISRDIYISEIVSIAWKHVITLRGDVTF
jgi:hypothetical protein